MTAEVKRSGQLFERVPWNRTDFGNSTYQLGEGLRLLESTGANDALGRFQEHLEESGFDDVRVQFPEPYEGTTRVNVYWNFREVVADDRRFAACDSLTVLARTTIIKDLVISGAGRHRSTIPVTRSLNQDKIYEALLKISENPIVHLMGTEPRK